LLLEISAEIRHSVLCGTLELKVEIDVAVIDTGRMYVCTVPTKRAHAAISSESALGSTVSLLASMDLSQMDLCKM
jgi:hypothetical protein